MENNDENSLVVDPFCGIGSSAVACKRLGVSFVGFDIDKEYLDESVTRVILKKYTEFILCVCSLIEHGLMHFQT